MAWLARTWIKERLVASLRLETEKEIETFRSELKSAEVRIASVSGAGIRSIAQMANASYPAKVSAVQTIWDAILLWNKATAVTQIVGLLTIDYVRENADDEGTQHTFRTMLDQIEYMDLMKRTAAAESARPHISPQAWALFLAYHSIMVTRMTKAVAVTMGLELAERIWESTDERGLIAKFAQEDILAAYDENSYAGTIKFLGNIKDQLAIELQRILSGEQIAPQTSAQAADLIAAAQNLIQDAEMAPEALVPEE